MGVYIDLPKDLIDQRKAAEVIGVSVSTLKTWRSSKSGPVYYTCLGRETSYSRADCVEYRRQSYRRIAPKE